MWQIKCRELTSRRQTIRLSKNDIPGHIDVKQVDLQNTLKSISILYVKRVCRPVFCIQAYSGESSKENTNVYSVYEFRKGI